MFLSVGYRIFLKMEASDVNFIGKHVHECVLRRPGQLLLFYGLEYVVGDHAVIGALALAFHGVAHDEFQLHQPVLDVFHQQ